MTFNTLIIASRALRSLARALDRPTIRRAAFELGHERAAVELEPD